MWLALFFFCLFCTWLFIWCAGELNGIEKSDQR